ncbi:DNA replication protein psf2 [Binucleata daphniae]
MIFTELKLIALQEEIEIEPLTFIPRLTLIQEDYGPYNPLQLYKVPLYIALTLKKSNKCKIRLPSFFDVEYLQDVLQKEEENEDYQQIHPFFFEMSIYIKECYNADNIDEKLVLVNKIKHARYNKTHEGLKVIDARAINLNNLTSYEFNEIKKYLLTVMQAANEIEKM